MGHTGKADSVKHEASRTSTQNPDTEGVPIAQGLVKVQNTNTETPDPAHSSCRTIAYTGGSPPLSCLHTGGFANFKPYQGTA